MRMSHALAGAILGLALALTGCGDDDGPGGSTPESPPFNDADVEFVRGMTPHHQQAIEMAALAQDKARDPAGRKLADDVAAAQGPEIDTMQSWLDEWGVNDDMNMEGHGDMDHDMSGMMSDQQMAELHEATGAAFDRTFLTLMIEHHESAIEMARTEQREGENPDAIELAEQIEAAQTREIDKMRAMLEQ